MSTDPDYNPFEPDYACSRCHDTHRIKVVSLCMPIGRLPDVGTPDAPGGDIEITYKPCPECSMSGPEQARAADVGWRPET